MSDKLSISSFSEELISTIPFIARYVGLALNRQSDPLTKGQMTLPQFLTLDLLNSNKTLMMKDIAGALYVSLPAATGMVKRLVGMKMVKRVYDKNDRRVVFISLTESGIKIIVRAKLARKKIIEEMFGNLSDKERKIYLKIIQKIKNNLYEKK
ncbi:MAG: MarR family transcriptional regulator [Candidatus Omnitrophica bacterium]|nr:MarR family transcriptional regulator [Candidatus Omnitrophota bacterium]